MTQASRLHLVDLAGSERVKEAKTTSGFRTGHFIALLSQTWIPEKSPNHVPPSAAKETHAVPPALAHARA